MLQVKTDTKTQLFVTLSEDTESKEKFVVIVLRDETSEEDKELFAQLTVSQTKSLIEILEEKVAYIEKMK